MLIEISLLRLLTYGAYSFLLFPLITGSIRKAYAHPHLKLIYLLICLFVFDESILVYYGSHHWNNLLFIRIGTFLEFFILSLFYYKVTIIRWTKAFIIAGFLIYSIIAILDYFVNSALKINNYALSTEALLMIIYTVTLSYQLMITEEGRMVDNPLFYINSAFLFYYSGNLFFFLFSSFMYDFANKAIKNANIVLEVINMIYYIPISIGFWKLKK